MPLETGAQKLARWVVDMRYEDLSQEVVSHAKRCMLDILGVQIRGATLPWIQCVYDYIRSMGGSGEATVSYYGDRLPVPYAAYVNSTFSYSCELQHHGSAESGHPGITIIPTLQALGEQLGSTGQEILAAMVAGYEVQGRLAMALVKPIANDSDLTLGQAIRKRHFHHMVFGVFSTAAAAGKLLRLDQERLAHAFAIAGSHASTIFEYDQSGGEVKRIHGAIATRNGIQSALLAKAGFTGPLTVFEGRRGIFASFGGSRAADSAQLFSDMGKPPYCVTRCTFRTYPCIGSAQHGTLDMVEALVKEHAFDYRDVESVRVGMKARIVPHITTITRPHDVISAQASLGFSLGVQLVKGSNSLDMYINPELWRDPEVLSVADKLQAYASGDDESQPSNLTQVEIKLKNGRVLKGEQKYIRGSEIRPYSQQDIEDKFRSLAGVLLSPDRVEHIIQTVAQLEQLPSILPLVPLLQKQ